MRRIVLTLLALGSLLLIVNAAARQRQQQRVPCGGEGTQFEANQCAHREYLAADAELNRVYKQLASRLEGEEERAKLKDAETAWIGYRDANCEYEAFFYRGGTMRPLIQSFCLARVTKARAAELKQQIEDQKQ